jgi:hypothetical protein
MRPRRIDDWPALVILAAVEATLVWDLLLSPPVWAAIQWLLG